MNITCKGCGLCCMHVGHPMFMVKWSEEHLDSEPDWEALPEDLKQKHVEYMESLDGDDEGQPCYWLDIETMTCKHHDLRPRVCREFEVGEEACLSFIEDREEILSEYRDSQEEPK